jgi:hypothetical protein
MVWFGEALSHNTGMLSAAVEFYFQRFGYCSAQIRIPPHPELRMVVVIPCYDESELLVSLNSLYECVRPDCAVEVIVVINSAIDSDRSVRQRNRSSLEAATEWSLTHNEERLRFHVLDCPDLSPKHAGVGLARKIGMDEAIRRLHQAGQVVNGVIICYDADCQCAPTYLSSIERHFLSHPETPGCSIYFEHPLEGPHSSSVYEAIVTYELHLRYYVQALRFAGFPLAHHTVGSCMAIRAPTYIEQGGMNKRKAGEDFYFLQKIIALGNFTDLTETTVYPSPRMSDRVPFGTGRAVRNYIKTGSLGTYPFQAFLDLQQLLVRFQSLTDGRLPVNALNGDLAQSLDSFLRSEGYELALAEIQGNTSDTGTFYRRFYRWLNPFRVMKFVHYARDHFYGEKVIETEARGLLLALGLDLQEGPGSLRALLRSFRALDRSSRSEGRSLGEPAAAGRLAT